MDYDFILVVSMKLRTCTDSQISLYSNDFNLLDFYDAVHTISVYSLTNVP